MLMTSLLPCDASVDEMTTEGFDVFWSGFETLVEGAAGVARDVASAYDDGRLFRMASS
jgi:hypothetical protein